MQGGIQALVLDSIIADLETRLPTKRFMHTLGVLQTAISLCNTHNGDIDRVCPAALLHDCAKGLDRTELESLITEGKIIVSALDKEFPALWHGAAGAYLARTEFNITDLEVLDAIENHTLGHASPSLTLQILMAADSLEPTRDYDKLDSLRDAVQKDLRTGLIAVLKEKVAHVNSKGRKPHPRIFETIASLEEE